jgi:hypothetical protein
MPEPVLSPEDAERIVDHMNEDHPKALIDYANAFAGVPDVQGARMTGIDAEGFDLVVERNEETRPVRIEFDTPLSTVGDARSRLVNMAMAVRQDGER